MSESQMVHGTLGGFLFIRVTELLEVVLPEVVVLKVPQ